MLSLNEHAELNEVMNRFDAVITDDIYDKAESYDIEEDPISLTTTVTLYDAAGQVLATVDGIEDYDMALGYLETEFDLEYYDTDEVDGDAQAGSTPWGQ